MLLCFGANKWRSLLCVVILLLLVAFCSQVPAVAQTGTAADSQGTSSSQSDLGTTEGWNQRLKELLRSAAPGESPAIESDKSFRPIEAANLPPGGEYRIGPDDLLKITVFEAPELNRSVRVSSSGQVSLPLLGLVKAAGLSPLELESVLEELLRRSYMINPEVGIFVEEMHSHGVSVVGAVNRPGVYQVAGVKTLIEILALAQGLAPDAGDTVMITHGPTSATLASGGAGELGRGEPLAMASEDGPSNAALMGQRPAEGGGIGDVTEVEIKQLLESGEPEYNLPIYAGDIVKVPRAGIVYVIGDVGKPGGFLLKNSEKLSLLQALALAEGLTETSAKGSVRIIRTDDQTGEKTEIPVNAGKILAGKEPDPILQTKDVVFVPSSGGKIALYKGIDAAIRTLSGVIIWGSR